MNPTNLSAGFADGRSTKVYGTVDLNMCFYCKLIKANFRILSNLESDLLIGLDILKSVVYQFNFENTVSTTCDKIKNNNEKEISDALQFIANDLKSFENIEEPTTASEHVIYLKPDCRKTRRCKK